MEFEQFLNPEDSSRAILMLRKLGAHDISGWVLTGGLAIEIHILLRGGTTGTRRRLHDIDFVAASFDRIPESLGSEMLLRHVHPHDAPSKTLLQAIDEELAIRVDVIRAYGNEMERVSPVEVSGIPLRIVSLKDVEAVHALECCDLLLGKWVDPKYARDFLRMLDLVKADEMEAIWQERRKPHCPESFAETARALRDAIASKPELLAPAGRVVDVDAVCPRCCGTEAFPLAEARQVLSILGYC
jgi:hypothetical protein